MSSTLINQSKRLFSGRSVVIVGGRRTPIGGFMGSLQTFTASQLGAFAVKGALTASHVDPNEVQELIMGHVLQAGCG